jgi:hypothetical protein
LRYKCAITEQSSASQTNQSIAATQGQFRFHEVIYFILIIVTTNVIFSHNSSHQRTWHKIVTSLSQLVTSYNRNLDSVVTFSYQNIDHFVNFPIWGEEALHKFKASFAAA